MKKVPERKVEALVSIFKIFRKYYHSKDIQIVHVFGGGFITLIGIII